MTKLASYIWSLLFPSYEYLLLRQQPRRPFNVNVVCTWLNLRQTSKIVTNRPNTSDICCYPHVCNPTLSSTVSIWWNAQHLNRYYRMIPFGVIILAYIFDVFPLPFGELSNDNATIIIVKLFWIFFFWCCSCFSSEKIIFEFAVRTKGEHQSVDFSLIFTTCLP